MKHALQRGARTMGLTLTDRQTEQFCRYYELLVEWNEKMNLTAITEPSEVVTKHFLDSLAGATEVEKVLEKGRCRLIDVGTGAGFPGIPLKIFFPEVELTLLDSLQKRVRFLETVVTELGLTGVQCIHGRAEDAAHQPELREQYEIAVARAVAAMPILLEYCAGYVKPGGLFLAYKGPSLPDELAEAKRELSMLQMCVEKVLEKQVPETDWNHYVAVVKKTGKLALQYPRKQSKIKKLSK